MEREGVERVKAVAFHGAQGFRWKGLLASPGSWRLGRPASRPFKE